MNTDGFNMISMEKFLNLEAMTGHLVNRTTGIPAFPPNNRTKWDGEDLKPLWEYLRDTTDVQNWKPDTCIAAFPAKPGKEDSDNFRQIFNTAVENKEPLDVPVPVNADPVMRLREMKKMRKNLCLNDENIQKANVIHFMCYHKARARLLTHFYTFLFFEDWRQELWAKRCVCNVFAYLRVVLTVCMIQKEGLTLY